LFTINNDSATVGSTISDGTHYATISNFNSVSDRLSLKLTNIQQSTEQDIDLSLGAPVALTSTNRVIVAKDLSLASLVDATALASQKTNIQSAINAAGTTTGNYSFVIDSNQGAAVYEIHYNAASG
jgi:hypothetical protein